ncbi:MAG: hypothetical protein R3B82_19190 [Sandaracinaceae bacterium]
MLRRSFHRCLVSLPLLLATASFAVPPEALPQLTPQAKSSMRVTRHFAAGLEYLVAEPRDVAPDAELPMIVVLHGRGGVPEAPTGPYLDLDVPVRVILPRGPLRSGDGYAWMPVSAHRGETEALTGPLRARLQELTDAMEIWQVRHPTRGRPIVTGFSQGGILAATLAVADPEAIERAYPIAGWIPPSLLPSAYDPFERHVPIHAFHGADDPVIGAARTRTQLESGCESSATRSTTRRSRGPATRCTPRCSSASAKSCCGRCASCPSGTTARA